MVNVAPVSITGQKPYKWLHLELHCQDSDERITIFRADDTCAYHLDLYHKFLEEIKGQPVTVSQVLDGGRITLPSAHTCRLFGYSSYFKLPNPLLPLEEQLAIRTMTKRTLEGRGYQVELGEIWW